MNGYQNLDENGDFDEFELTKYELDNESNKTFQILATTEDIYPRIILEQYPTYIVGMLELNELTRKLLVLDHAKNLTQACESLIKHQQQGLPILKGTLEPLYLTQSIAKALIEQNIPYEFITEKGQKIDLINLKETH